MNDELFREMDPEDPFYMGTRYCTDCHFCRYQQNGSLSCSVTGRRITDDSQACANFMQ